MSDGDEKFEHWHGDHRWTEDMYGNLITGERPDWWPTKEAKLADLQCPERLGDEQCTDWRMHKGVHSFGRPERLLAKFNEQLQRENRELRRLCANLQQTEDDLRKQLADVEQERDIAFNEGKAFQRELDLLLYGTAVIEYTPGPAKGEDDE
jgi:hypothetical protein